MMLIWLAIAVMQDICDSHAASINLHYDLV